MTEKDTLLDILVFCEMTRKGLINPIEAVGRIEDRLKPMMSEGLKDSLFRDNCRN